MTAWTDERTDLLRKLWSDGLPASQIAAELGIESRNAVIGKVHRLKLAGRAKPGAAPRRKKSSPWNDPRAVELALEFRADGRTAQQNANAIYSEIGVSVSRNAVNGKLRALGVSQKRPSRIAAALFSGYRAGRQLPAPREEAAVTPSPDQAAVTLVPQQPRRCTIMDLDNAFSKCRWPEGDPRDPDFFYCGGKTIEGLSYCGYHSRIAYQPAESGRRRAG